MLPDRFFQEYGETASRSKAADNPETEETKDTFTAADVDKIVSEKVTAALEEMKASLAAAQAETKGEQNNEEGNNETGKAADNNE